MRIAINTLSVRGGGGLTFLKNLLRYLPTQGLDDEFVVLVTQSKIDALGLRKPEPNVKLMYFPERNWVVRAFWEQTVLPVILRRHRIDVLYAPGNQGPVVFPCRFAVLVQNVDPLICEADGMSASFKLKLRVLRTMTRLSVYRARSVIAISQYTRKLLCDQFGCKEDRIVVVPHGSPEDAQSSIGSAVGERIAPLIPKGPFFLAVSSVKHNKNYETLIEAFVAVVSAGACELVIAGEIEHRECYVRLSLLLEKFKISQYVHFLGEVDNQTLRYLYQRAHALIFPSRIESFGLPPLEAMTYGVPVAASRIDPVVEVCADAVAYFDPENVGDISRVMLKLLFDRELREDLISRGRARSRDFSWTATAEATLEILQAATTG